MKIRNYRLLSYEANLIEGTLKLLYGHQGANYKSRIKVNFSGVVAHHLETVNKCSRIWDIEVEHVDELEESIGVVLERTKDYNFPIPYKTLNNLKKYLLTSDLKCYRILPTEGMVGVIFAESIEVDESNA